MKTMNNQLCHEPGRMPARSHSKYQGPEAEKSLVGSRDGEKKLVGLYHRKRGRLHTEGETRWGRRGVGNQMARWPTDQPWQEDGNIWC